MLEVVESGRGCVFTAEIEFDIAETDLLGLLSHRYSSLTVLWSLRYSFPFGTIGLRLPISRAVICFPAHRDKRRKCSRLG